MVPAFLSSRGRLWARTRCLHTMCDAALRIWIVRKGSKKFLQGRESNPAPAWQAGILTTIFFFYFFFCSPFESRTLFLLGRWSGVLSNILRWLVDERQLVDGASISFFSWTSLMVESEPVNLRIRMKKLLCFDHYTTSEHTAETWQWDWRPKTFSTGSGSLLEQKKQSAPAGNWTRI